MTSMGIMIKVSLIERTADSTPAKPKWKRRDYVLAGADAELTIAHAVARAPESMRADMLAGIEAQSATTLGPNGDHKVVLHREGADAHGWVSITPIEVVR